ncbi:hypothetical protein ABMA27_002495 [Loxostege sticticalis]|uniref:Uncharacterized protein n=1 Tax=Loxostege sticticalis TaxID=481309 RepID=A0ABR3HTW7_LOXSC
MIGLVIVAAVFQVILCQVPHPFPPNVPEQCRRPPQGVSERPHECCKIPSFFPEEDFQECGFKKLEDGPEGPGPRGPRGPHGPPDCTKQICIMKKHNLLKEESSVDPDAAKEFLQKWAEANPEWKEPMEKAIENCVGKQLPGPPQICEPNKMVFCLSSTLFGACPKWEESEGCQTLKAHIEECSQFFPKP